MKKLLFALGCIGALVLAGCEYTDYPVPVNGTEVCDDNCATLAAKGSTLVDYNMGISGPSYSVYPNEIGEYWLAVMQMDPGVATGCTRWAGGGGFYSRVDTYRNEAASQYTTCPNSPTNPRNGQGCPCNYICMSGGPWEYYGWHYASCYPRTGNPAPADMVDGYLDGLCNTPNGTPCFDQFSYFEGYGYGPNTANPGTFLTELYYVAVDKTPGGTCEFDNNVVRQPGQLCQPCSAADDTGDAADDNADNGGTQPPAAGLEAPPGDYSPAWYLAMCWYGHPTWGWAEVNMNAGLPYVPEAGQTVSVPVANVLSNLYRTNAVEKGFLKLSVSKLTIGSQTLDLSAPLEVNAKLAWTGDRLAKNIAVKTGAPLQEFMNFVADHLQAGQPIDWYQYKVTLTDGTTINGSDLSSALPKVVLNRDAVKARYAPKDVRGTR